MARHLKTIVVLTALLAVLSTGALAESWTDATGKFTVEAEFLAIRGANVYLKKSNGVTIAVPLEKLNTESQALAKRLAAGPAPVVAADTPDAAVRAVKEGVESGNLRVVWDALPSGYQNDVHSVIHLFGENMDPAIWNTGTGIVKKAVAVLKEKKDFILAHPGLANAPVDGDTIDQNWDAVVDLLDTFVNSEITDLAKLKTFDVGVYIDGTGAKLSDKMVALAKVLDEQGVSADQAFPGVEIGKVTDAKIETISVDGDTATVRITSPDGEVEEHEAVRVDGKWLPKEMVDGWAEGIAAAKSFLSTEMKPQLEQGKAFVLPMMKGVESIFDQLLAAATQEEFNKIVDEQIGQLLAGFMGGGPDAGGPGPGGPAADPFGGGADPFGAGDDAADDNDPFGN